MTLSLGSGQQQKEFMYGESSTLPYMVGVYHKLNPYRCQVYLTWQCKGLTRKTRQFASSEIKVTALDHCAPMSMPVWTAEAPT